jgi:hypothetical protein
MRAGAKDVRCGSDSLFSESDSRNGEKPCFWRSRTEARLHYLPRRELVITQNALRRRFEQSKSDGDLPEHADAAGLADFITYAFQGMTQQAINGADREQLLRIAKTALRAWPKQNAESDCRDGSLSRGKG